LTAGSKRTTNLLKLKTPNKKREKAILTILLKLCRYYSVECAVKIIMKDLEGGNHHLMEGVLQHLSGGNEKKKQ
jgi:hypothetical protein